jgi:two-component system, NarL family, sensor kinase
LFSFLLYWLLTPNAYTQATNIDSLQNLLKTAKEDTNKVKLYKNLFAEYYTNDTEKAMNYINQALSLSKKIGYKKGIGDCYNNRGVLYWINGDYKLALDNYTKSIEIRKEINDEIGMASNYTNIGVLQEEQGNYADALKNHLKSLKIEEKLKNKQGIAYSLSNIGIIEQSYRNNYKKALDYYLKALDILLELNDLHGLSNIYLNIGNIYEAQNDLKLAMEYHLKSLEIKEEQGDIQGIGVSYVEIGSLHQKEGNFSEALKYYFKAVELLDVFYSREIALVAYMNIAAAYLNMREDELAKEYYKKALPIAEEDKKLKNLSLIYLGLSDMNYASKNYKTALDNFKHHIVIKDSLFNIETSKQISELQIQYETEKKDQQIALLEKERQLTDADTKRKNILVASSVGGFVLVVLVLFLFYNRRQLKKQNFLQKELTGAVVKGQDEERKRIAKDLHDGLGTLLSTARINVNTLEDKIPAGNENKKLFDNALQIIDKLNSEVRHIAQNLMPETLNEFGLVAALEELIDTVNRTGKLKIIFKHYKLTNELEKQLEINLYRIVQEIVNNAIKHSKATQLSMELVQHEDSMVLLTEDNGTGFTPENQAGMGIKNIQARLNVFNGILHIDSNPNNGTTTTIEIPLLV